MPHIITADIVIMGSGPGGAAVAYALKDCGADILVLERGGFLPVEPANWNAKAVFVEGRYKTSERWFDKASGALYHPGNHYWVGGQTKMYGANLQRLRLADFVAHEHEDGISPEWPITYDDLEPFYTKAEQIYAVRGQAGIDPTEPPRSAPFPYPPIPHEPAIEELVSALQQQGLRPYPLEMAIHWEDGGCNPDYPCTGCDGFPCYGRGKADAETQCLQPALESSTVRLMTDTLVNHLHVGPGGQRVEYVDATCRGENVVIKASRFVLSCGAVNSPLVLLRSVSSAWPDGIGNKFDQVGRNYMLQNQSALMAVRPAGKTNLTMQKTVGLHDFLLPSQQFPYPAGAIQTLGKLTGALLQADKPYLPQWILDRLADRSVDWWMTSEELPDPNNRITLGKHGGIEVTWRPNNQLAHIHLLNQTRKMLRNAGYPLIFHRRFGISANAHQCGTLRMSSSPISSVCDAAGKIHDVANLFVCDASLFPSSTAMAPTLTISALGLRLGQFLG